MTDDAGAKLLAAFEALAAEVRGMRDDFMEDMEAKATLANRRMMAAARQARSRARHGAGGFAAGLRESIYERDGNKCLLCGATERLSIDHIVPRAKGGDDDISNLQTLCIPCNAKKNSGDFRVTSVTQRDATPQVLKALDLDLEAKAKEQDLKPAASRHVTSRTVTPLPGPKETGAVWRAYAEAYRERYHVEPVRNAKVNGQITQLVKRLGQDAPEVAAFFVRHGAAFYVLKGHAVGLLLNDAEKLAMEWKRGVQITATSARQQDATQTNADSWAEFLSPEGKRALVSE